MAPSSSISLGWLMPASMTQNASSPVAANMDRGRPIWLFRFMCVLAVGPRRLRTCASSSLTVVLPAVPVSPITRVSPRRSRQQCASFPSALTVSSTRMSGTGGTASNGFRDTSSAAAPASAALTAKSCPSNVSPGMQTNRDPGFTARLSVPTPSTMPQGAAPATAEPSTARTISSKLRRIPESPGRFADR